MTELPILTAMLTGESMRPTVTRKALLNEERDGEFRALINGLTRLGDVLSGARRHLASMLDVTPAQYSILMVVAEASDAGGMSVVDVAEAIHVTGPFVTTQANQLVAAGLLEKAPNPADGRSVLLQLSERGRSETERIAPYLQQFNDRFFATLTKAEFRQLTATVLKLIDTGEKTLVAATATDGRMPVSARRAIMRTRSR